MSTTTGPCTKGHGHWVWNNPMTKTDENRFRCTILLMDNEGVTFGDHTMGGCIENMGIASLSFATTITKDLYNNFGGETTMSKLGEFS
ncbi:unnamed protein product [Lactuca virosa]|uniref:Uncharacterized protein n=1 Tax=Lactuca virosa TaxID=75947 RepID=A0AAU9MA24_9ASTR|nr:unnamed protein product [Lactuca virosa]